MKTKIRAELVVDCPKEKRVVPLNALAGGANHAQLTCRHCPFFQKATCTYVTCNYKEVLSANPGDDLITD